tara:strand:+ start:1739 stop:1939 length:201 start_codon:yes stop_codon:yes gene_type:complete
MANIKDKEAIRNNAIDKIMSNYDDIKNVCDVNLGYIANGSKDKLPSIFFVALRDSIDKIEQLNEKL